MSKNSEWGDHLVLSAIVYMLGRKVTVINVRYDDSIRKTDLEPTSGEDEGRPRLFLGHIGESHYQSLRPLQWELTWPKGLLFCPFVAGLRQRFLCSLNNTLQILIIHIVVYILLPLAQAEAAIYLLDIGLHSYFLFTY